MRTPLKKARHLGSAKEGSGHFWKQRVTAVSNLVLVLFLVWFIASLTGAGQPAVKQALANPLVALAFSALIISGNFFPAMTFRPSWSNSLLGSTSASRRQ